MQKEIWVGEKEDSGQLETPNSQKRVSELPKAYVLTIGIIPANELVASPNFVPYYFFYV